MKLVVDTNRVIAALVKDSASRRILFSSKFVFFSVRFSILEVQKYKSLILKKTGLSEADFLQLMDLVFSKVTMVDDSEISNAVFLKAKAAMDYVDKNDTVFVAAALSLGCDGIWSDDRHFSKQKLAKTFSTAEMLKIL